MSAEQSVITTSDSIIKALAESGIDVAETPEKGRHCVASQKFSRGSVILAADPDIESLSDDTISGHCSNCYAIIPDDLMDSGSDGSDSESCGDDDDSDKEEESAKKKVFVCPGCKTTRYCSEECRREHWEKTHRAECKYFSELYEMSILLVRAINSGLDWHFLRPSPSFDPAGIDSGYVELFDDIRRLLGPGKAVPDNDTLYLLAESINNNAFSIEDEETEAAGTGVYLEASLFSHSCVPNTARAFRNKRLFVIASEDIEPGEEITITYSNNLIADLEERRKELYSSYGFTCACPRCLGEASKDPSSVYYRRAMGLDIPSDAPVSAECVMKSKEVLTKLEIEHKYEEELEMLHKLFPPEQKILDVYYPFNSFSYVIERGSIASEKVGNKEEELYYTGVYAKCCECKNMYIYICVCAMYCYCRVIIIVVIVCVCVCLGCRLWERVLACCCAY